MLQGLTEASISPGPPQSPLLSSTSSSSKGPQREDTLGGRRCSEGPVPEELQPRAQKGWQGVTAVQGSVGKHTSSDPRCCPQRRIHVHTPLPHVAEHPDPRHTLGSGFTAVQAQVTACPPYPILHVTRGPSTSPTEAGGADGGPVLVTPGNRAASARLTSLPANSHLGQPTVLLSAAPAPTVSTSVSVVPRPPGASPLIQTRAGLTSGTVMRSISVPEAPPQHSPFLRPHPHNQALPVIAQPQPMAPPNVPLHRNWQQSDAAFASLVPTPQAGLLRSCSAQGVGLQGQALITTPR